MRSYLLHLSVPLCVLALTLGGSDATVATAATAAASPSLNLKQAQLLYERKHFEEALALARQVVAGQPPAKTADRAHVLICKVRAELPEPPPAEGDAPLEAAGSAPASGSGRVTAPTILNRTNPPSTSGARFQGTVTLAGFIDEEGCVVGIKVVQGWEPGFDAHMIATLRQWTFRPAQYQGKPFKVRYSTTIRSPSEKDKS